MAATAQQTQVFMVSGFTGSSGGLTTHRFKVDARNKTEAKRRISRSTIGYSSWDGEKIRQLDAGPWEDWMNEVGGVRDLTVRS